MNQPFRTIKQRIIFSKPLSVMNENLKDEIQQFTSSLQRLDSKIDALQFSIREDLKPFAMKEDLKSFAMKDDLKQLATKDDLNRLEDRIDLKFATKEDIKLLATKEDLFRLEERNDLRYATKDNLSQQKFDLIKWIFTFWISLAIMILGLYLKK